MESRGTGYEQIKAIGQELVVLIKTLDTQLDQKSVRNLKLDCEDKRKKLNETFRPLLEHHSEGRVETMTKLSTLENDLRVAFDCGVNDELPEKVTKVEKVILNLVEVSHKLCFTDRTLFLTPRKESKSKLFPDQIPELEIINIKEEKEEKNEEERGYNKNGVKQSESNTIRFKNILGNPESVVSIRRK